MGNSPDNKCLSDTRRTIRTNPPCRRPSPGVPGLSAVTARPAPPPDPVGDPARYGPCRISCRYTPLSSEVTVSEYPADMRRILITLDISGRELTKAVDVPNGWADEWPTSWDGRTGERVE